MAEATLSLDQADLESRVGKFLGYGRGDSFGDPAWSATQEKDIKDCIESGLRQFYFPTVTQGGPPHEWSFLKPWANLDVPASVASVLLPDDFGGFEGQIAVFNAPTSSSSGQTPWAVPLTNSGLLRSKFAEDPTLTGRPMLAALEPVKGTTQLRGQIQQLSIWPTTDQPYRFQFQYYVLPDALSTANPFHYGGGSHAETVMEACLMAAEQFLDNASEVHAMKFQERLLASIAMDNKHKPQRFGVNEDRSDMRNWKGKFGHYLPGVLGTYNGLSMD